MIAHNGSVGISSQSLVRRNGQLATSTEQSLTLAHSSPSCSTISKTTTIGLSRLRRPYFAGSASSSDRDGCSSRLRTWPAPVLLVGLTLDMEPDMQKRARNRYRSGYVES